MPKGTITRLIIDRGFGFIRTEQGEDLFFHRNDLEGVNYNSLREGQQVEFQVAEGPDSSSAVRVRLIETQAPEPPPSRLS
jgi:CspA family cold shock protein